jgi:SAM-dependent methyltransferase
MARENAAQRGLNVRFNAADICRMPAQAERYDLIVDGHCLHYFVLDEHRRAALAAIRRMLKTGGLFLIETMISHPGLLVGPKYRIDGQGVLSIKLDEPAGHEGAFTSDGDWFAPYRRLLTEGCMLTELGDAGFAIQSHHAITQNDPRKPMLLQIRAGLQPA